MTWTKIDDQFHAHPKVLHAWQAHRAAIGLHMLALSYCARYLTDGHVPEVFVKTQLPTSAERRRTIAALTDAGLWQRNGSGWLIHDYLDYNESREAVLVKRSEAAGKRSAAGRKGAANRWQGDGKPHGKAMANGWQGDGNAMAPVPTPSPFP